MVPMASYRETLAVTVTFEDPAHASHQEIPRMPQISPLLLWAYF